MTRKGSISFRKGLAFIALLLLAGGAALAQETGRLQGTVMDEEGNPMPAVTMTLSGVGAPQVQVTDAQGNYRFVALDPGQYQLRAELEGYGIIEYPTLAIAGGRSSTVDVTLPGAVEAVVTVTSESPLLDERKIQQGTTISQVELEKIPSARDPWAILTQAGGVISDRVNVGGNESGQQAVFVGLGVSDDENSFLLDGVEITDMAAIGASPTYYDFDQFTQIQVGVGGTDITKTAPGVAVNLITKRGTNEFRGSARYLATKGGGFFTRLDQATPDISPADLGRTGIGEASADQEEFLGNRIDNVEDIGVEAGGALVQDQVWLWGSWGQNDIKNDIPGGTLPSGEPLFLNDDTILENTAIKLNAQIASRNSLNASWNNGDKQKFGRDASPTRPVETTWDQTGPSALLKIQDTHVFSPNFFLTGTYAKGDFGFELAAKGGLGTDAPEAWRDGSSVWHDGFLSGFGKRPTQEFKIDGSFFFNTGARTNHELTFGARSREFEDTDIFAWPGRNVFSLALGGGSFPLVVFRRGGAPPNELSYESLWVQDTIAMGRLTINAGLRYDLQDGKNVASNVEGPPPGVPAIGPDGELTTVDRILPDVTVREENAPFDWESILPRVGVTYALGAEQKTLLRASFSQFAEQLESTDVARLNPGYYAYAYFLNLTDYEAGTNPNHKFDTGDLLYFLFPAYFDPKNPTVSANRTDPGLDPPITNELTFNVEHALLPEFVIGAGVVWRNTEDILETRDFIRAAGSATVPGRIATRNDYVPDGTVDTTLPDGRQVSVPIFALNPASEFSGGNLLLNGDREIGYTGAFINLTKRLSNRWMARGYFQFGEAEWDVPDSYLQFDDPNPFGCCPAAVSGSPGNDVDGGLAAIVSAGSGAKGDVVLQSSWSWNLNGMYQVAPDQPWGFNIAANLFGREGYVLPLMFETTGSDGNTRLIQLTRDIDDFRADDIFNTDVRIEKEFGAAEDIGLTFSIDVFNVFNENYVLQRERDMATGSAWYLRETLSPRIYRLGARIAWR
jgi:hypothetical protein